MKHSAELIALALFFGACSVPDSPASAGGKVATPVTGVTLDKSQLNFVVGSSPQGLVATVAPRNATKQAVTWATGNPGVAAVDQNGLVAPKSVGTTFITVTTVDGGKSASCRVSVTSAPVAVSGVSLDRSSLDLLPTSAPVKLVATMAPSDATNLAVTWNSSHPDVATVESSGLVTPKAVGTTTITVTTSDEGKTATCAVQVSLPQPVAGVALDQAKVELMVSGGPGQLVATVSPATAADPSVSWSSSNPQVATVDAMGRLTPVRAGTVTVTATTHDGGKTATSRVVVYPAWTWISGNSLPTLSATRSYGTKGVEDQANNPGTRDNAIAGTDASGNLWVFGGLSYANGAPGSLNDVWKLNASTGLWTWMAGSTALNSPATYGTTGVSNGSNTPGGADSGSGWFLNGSLWFRGGNEFDDGSFVFNGTPRLSSRHGDQLWQYSTASAAWTFWEGTTVLWNAPTPVTSATKMGPRVGSATWTDSTGKVWVFGGWYNANYPDFGTFNDLWEFVPTTRTWTKLSGSLTANANGVYGTKGQPAPGNTPGARDGAITWTDPQGRLWLYGGYGFGASGTTEGPLNDLWRFDPPSQQWTWVAGSSSLGQPGSWMVGKGVPDATNSPPALSYANSWTDDLGQLWLFGGATLQRGVPQTNFLWMFDGTSWTLMGGDAPSDSGTGSAEGGVGSFGTRGVTTASNYPPARVAAASGGAGSTRWLFGGWVNDPTAAGYGNDLWKVRLK